MVANRWVTWLREGQWHRLPPSEDFSGSSTLSKKIHLATVSLSVTVFHFVLEEHKCDVELLILLYALILIKKHAHENNVKVTVTLN